MSEPGEAVVRAMADMRAGLSVIVVAAGERRARKLFDQAALWCLKGERVLRAPGSHGAIRRAGGGGISFALYAGISYGTALRGVIADRVYFDHTAAHETLAPGLVGSAAAGPRIVHLPVVE